MSKVAKSEVEEKITDNNKTTKSKEVPKKSSNKKESKNTTITKKDEKKDITNKVDSEVKTDSKTLELANDDELNKADGEVKTDYEKEVHIDEQSDTDNKNTNREHDKYDTVSLKEIREALENKVNEKQKNSVIKEVVLNIFIGLIMIMYLIVVKMGSFNINNDFFEKDIKFITLCILAIGIFILELSYKKDSTKLVLHGVEVLVFGASNLCLIYVMKLYSNNFTSILKYIGIGIIAYYILKSIILTIINIKRYKRDNNDIKDIVKKKVEEI